MTADSWREVAEEKREALEKIAESDLPLAEDVQTLLDELDGGG